MAARVGLKNSSWEDRGSNDGAVSEDAPESGEATIGWVVYNTFRRNDDQLELMLRVMTRNHRLVGKEVMGEVKVEFVRVGLTDFFLLSALFCNRQMNTRLFEHSLTSSCRSVAYQMHFLLPFDQQ